MTKKAQSKSKNSTKSAKQLGVNKVLAKKNGREKNPKNIAKTQPKKSAEKSAKPISSKYPRHTKNPFRSGSSYATAFDILAAHKTGIRRDEAVKLLAQEMHKPEKNANWDISVLCTARDGNESIRHKSCKSGFWVKRENDHLTLMID